MPDFEFEDDLGLARADVELLEAKLHQASISAYPLAELDPHWITGFADGEGCFSLTNWAPPFLPLCPYLRA